jgi:parallel beta-helix repeat protein
LKCGVPRRIVAVAALRADLAARTIEGGGMRRFSLLLALAAASFAAAHVGVANAAACGAVTSSTTLTSDCDAPLTIAASGITVNLGGHSIVCNDPTVDGIVIPATVSSARVKNGFVVSGSANCTNGVHVLGDSNQLTRLSVSNASVQGVFVEGDSNRFVGIRSQSNGNDGFISLGSFNVVHAFTARNNNDDGIGFFLGSDNAVTDSVVIGNADKGIISGSNSTTIFGNTISDNDRGIYLSDGSSGSRITANAVFSNGTGIEVNSTSSSNRITSNVSLGNNLDMSDDNVDCDADIWTFNLFQSSNESCIH